MTFLPRIPFLLYSYLATEMLAPFFASFLVMNAVFFLVKLIPFLNFVLQLDINITDFFRLLSYMFPGIFLYTIPMSAMLGITIGFSRLSSDSEILAIKAAGVSMYRILPPVIIVSSIISIIAFYFSIALIPASEISMKQLTYQIIKEKVDRGIQEHKFTEALGEIVLHIDDLDEESGEWRNVWVSDTRDVEFPTIIMASSGLMQRNEDKFAVTISLFNGSMHRTSAKSSEIITFDKYTINIPLQMKGKPFNKYHKRLLSMPQLLEMSEKEGLDNKDGRKYLVEYHKRLVLPVGCLMLSFLALPLGLQARAGKKAIGIPVGLIIFIVYYIIHTMGKELAESGDAPIGFTLWLPNFLFFGLAVFWIFRVTHEKPLIPEKMYYFFKGCYQNTLEPVILIIKRGVNRLYSKSV